LLKSVYPSARALTFSRNFAIKTRCYRLVVLIKHGAPPPPIPNPEMTNAKLVPECFSRG